MPIDPRIPLAVGSPQMPDYASQYGQVLQLREMIRLADDRQLERDRSAEEEDLRRRMKGAYAFDPEGNLDRPTTLKNFRDIDPVTALTLQQGWKTGDVAARLQKFETHKAEQQAEMAELDRLGKLMALGAKLTSSATDPASFKLMQQEGLKHGLLTQEEVDEYPEFNTKAVLWLKQKENQALTAQQQFQARQDEIAKKREKIEFEQAQQTFGAEQRESDLSLVGQVAPFVDSQEDLVALNEMTDDRVKDIIGDIYSPQTTPGLLADVSRTAQERATEEHRRLTRVETERHHLETTAAARARANKKDTVADRQKLTSLRSELRTIGTQLDKIHARRTLLGKGLETGMYYPKSGKPEEFDPTNWSGKKDSGRAKAVKAEIDALGIEAADLTDKRDRKIRRVRTLEEGGAAPGRAAAPATRAAKPRGGRPNTEADIRRRAKEAGIDPDILVEDARALGLLR